MKNEIIEIKKDEWYQELVEEGKAIMTEAVFTSRWALVEGYWNLGKLIRDEKHLKKWAQKEAGAVLQGLAKDLGIPMRTLHYALKSYDKYPKTSQIPEGKNITWNKLTTKYLTGRKSEKEEECEHEDTYTITICRECGQRIKKDGQEI